MRFPALGVLAFLVSCGDEDEPTYVQFNATDDTLSLQIGAEELLDDVEVELHSSTGEVVIGTAKASPGGGPVGTEHDFVIVIDDEYEDLVDRVSIRLDSGERGEDEFDLDRDSADEGLYKLSLVSVGEEGEVREDTVTIRAWELDETDEDGEDGDSGSR